MMIMDFVYLIVRTFFEVVFTQARNDDEIVELLSFQNQYVFHTNKF